MRLVDESEYLPKSQGTHSARASFSSSPSLQLKQIVRARFEICFVSGQVSQLVMPYKGAYSLRAFWRSLHAEQLVIAADAPYFPGTQSVQTVLAAAEYLPGRHA
jgi:hypothetical protein